MRGPTPALMEAMGKLADREIKAGRMLDTGGLMPVADGRAGTHHRRQAQRDRRPLRRDQGNDRRLRDLRTARQGRGRGRGEGVHAAAPRSHAGLGRHLRSSRASRRRAWTAPARSMRAPTPDARVRQLQSAAMTAADVHRTILAVWRIEQPRLITRPVPDAARCAAGRRPDAGSAGGGARALARHRRAGKARRVADGDRQTPRARSSAPPQHARAQARDADARPGAGAAGDARFRTRRSTTISATNCCG